MANLDLYNKVREVPKDAKKTIIGGRLKGMTDVNPMWRIKKLTEEFGPCGFGWFYEILEERLEPLPDGQIAAFVRINLYVMVDGKSSAPIPGTGGNMFRVQERNGMHTNDECFKMALTDAISVASKALGFGADVYWNSDKTKYSQDNSSVDKNATVQEITDAQIKMLYTLADKKGVSKDDLKAKLKEAYGIDSTKELTKKQFDAVKKGLENKEDK